MSSRYILCKAFSPGIDNFFFYLGIYWIQFSQKYFVLEIVDLHRQWCESNGRLMVVSFTSGTPETQLSIIIPGRWKFLSGNAISCAVCTSTWSIHIYILAHLLLTEWKPFSFFQSNRPISFNRHRIALRVHFWNSTHFFFVSSIVICLSICSNFILRLHSGNN